MRRLLRPLLVLLAAGSLGAACVRPATGVSLTVDSSRLLDLGISIDLFRVIPSTAAGPLEAQELAIIGRPVQAIETFTINLDGSLGGERVFLLVEAVQADSVVGSGTTEAELIAGEHVPAQVILRLCEAAGGPFCDGDELVTCDAVTDETLRDYCPFTCNPGQLRCNDCFPSTLACNGDVLVDCDADGNITAATMSCASLGLVCDVDACVDCTPGVVDCRPDPAPALSGTIVVCDGAGTIVTSTACPYGCEDKSAVCYDCFAGTTHCIGDDLVECAADGTIVTQTPCTYGCSDAAAACNACTPAPAGTTSLECQGADLVECDDTGGFVASTACTAFGCNTTIDPDACNECDPDPSITTQCIGDDEVSCSTGGQIVTSVDCVAMGTTCNPLTGGCNTCTPGSTFCTGLGDIASCDASGTPVITATCPYGCNTAGGAPACNVCTPDTIECQGTDLVDCDPTGSVVENTTDCSAYGCQTGTAPDQCNECTPGTVECQGSAVVSCNSFGIATGTTPCTYGCDSAPAPPAPDVCYACTPGTSACQGASFVVCSGAGTIVSSTACGTLGDSCNSGVCTPTGCEAVPFADGTICSDGLFCTTGDDCTAGACGGVARDCSDGNACTADTCDESVDLCINNAAVLNGTLCDDGAYCTIGETCSGGVCSGAVPRSCADASACTLDSCDETTDACVNDAAAANGSACSDGLFCTIGDTCTGGTCTVSGPLVCNDSNVCTVDSCSEATDTCVFDFSTTGGMACADALYCTVSTTCTSGVCGGGSPRSCADPNPCTLDSCNESMDICVNDAAGSENTFCGTEMLCCGGSCMASDETNCGLCGNVCPAPSPGCVPADLCFHNTCVDEGILVITELAIDPMGVSDTVGEWVEVYNPTLLPIDLGGWVLRDDATDLHNVSMAVPVVVPAGGFAVLVRSNTPATNCGVTGTYQYSSFVLGNAGDEVVLEASGCVVDRVNYASSFVSSGNAKNLDSLMFDATLNDMASSWCNATTPMSCGDDGTPGMPNLDCP